MSANPFKKNKLMQTKTNTVIVLMAKPKSELILPIPYFAKTEVRPAKNAASNA